MKNVKQVVWNWWNQHTFEKSMDQYDTVWKDGILAYRCLDSFSIISPENWLSWQLSHFILQIVHRLVYHGLLKPCETAFWRCWAARSKFFEAPFPSSRSILK
jgi:hypothetical protein